MFIRSKRNLSILMIVTLFFGLFSGTSLKVHAANVRVTGEKAIAIPVSFNGNSKDYNCGNVSATKLELSFQVTPYDGIDLSKEITETYQIVFEKEKLDEAFNKFVTPGGNLWDTELYINSFAYLDGIKDNEENNQIIDLFQNNSFKLSKKGNTYYLNDNEIESKYINDDTVTCDFNLSLENNKRYDKYLPQKVGLIFDLHSNNFIYDGPVTIKNLSMKATKAENTDEVFWNFIPGDSSVSYNEAESKLCKLQFDQNNHNKKMYGGDFSSDWYPKDKSFEWDSNSIKISANDIFYNQDFIEGGYSQNSFTLDGNFRNDENNKYSMKTLSGSTIEEEIILPNELFENGNFPEDASIDFYTNLSFFNQDTYWVRLEKEHGNPVLNYYARENDKEVKVESSKASSLGQLSVTDKNNFKILHIELPVGIPFDENEVENNININTRIEGDCIKYQGNFFCSGFRLKKGQECFAEYYPDQYLPVTPIKNICSIGTKHNFGNAKTNPGCIYEIYDNGSLENIADGTTILKGMPVVFEKEKSLIQNMNGCTSLFQPNNENIPSNTLACLNIRIPKELMDLYAKDGIRIQPYVNYSKSIQGDTWAEPNCDDITVLIMQNGQIVAQVYKDCRFDAGIYNKKHLVATNTVSYNDANSYYDVSVSTNVICKDQDGKPLDIKEVKSISFDCNVVPVYTSESIQSMVYVSGYSLKDSFNQEYLTNVKESFSRFNFCDYQTINTFFTNYAFGKSQYQNIYTINYVLNDAEDSKASNPNENVTKYNENVVFELKEPSRTGYTFEGWYSDAELLTPVSVLKNQDATVYAAWKKINNNLQIDFVNSTQSPVYTGSFIRPAVIVTTTVNTKKIILKQNSDYTVSYKNNKDVGTAQVIITGINGYEGSVSKSFSISPASMSSNEIKVSEIGTVSYNKAACTPEPTIYYYGYPLVKDKDYTLSFENNTTPGKAAIQIKGINNFTGTKSINFTIESSTSKPDLGLGALTLDSNAQKQLTKSYTYTGKEQKPTIKSFILNGKKLNVNKQYKIIYENNIHAGVATVKAIGIGDYIGSRTLGNFSIKAKLITVSKITVPASVSYTGKAISNIPVVVTDGKNVLREGEDYQVTFKPLVSNLFDRWLGNTRVSIAVTAIEGNGHDYVNKYYKKKGVTMVKPFTKNIYIAKCDLNSKTATVKMSDIKLNGKPVSSLDEECVPMVQVTYNDTVLENGMKKDYILSYKINNKKKTVTITAKATSDGNYKGKIVGTFNLIDTGEEDD